MKNIFYLLISFVLVIGCVSKKQEITQDDNFSFMISYMPCIGSSFYDSSSNTLVRTNIDGSGPFTITLGLTEDELNQIFNKLIETDFFNLPKRLKPPINSNRISIVPSSTYKIRVTNGYISHSVFWDSEIITEPLYEKAEQFRELFWFIFDIIWSHPEYQEIPKDMAACL